MAIEFVHVHDSGILSRYPQDYQKGYVKKFERNHLSYLAKCMDAVAQNAFRKYNSGIPILTFQNVLIARNYYFATKVGEKADRRGSWEWSLYNTFGENYQTGGLGEIMKDIEGYTSQLPSILSVYVKDVERWEWLGGKLPSEERLFSDAKFRVSDEYSSKVKDVIIRTFFVKDKHE